MVEQGEIAVPSPQSDNACACERTCIVTRACLSPDELIRFVRDPDDRVVPDLARKLPGRGVWVTCDKSIVAQAVAKKSFAKAFRAKVTADPALADQVEALMVRRAIEALSLANKAGGAICGQTKVNAALESGRVTALIQAHDAAEATRARLVRKYEAICRDLEISSNVFELLSIAELSLAFGRENVVHAALIDRRSAVVFVQAGERLMRYRSATLNDVAQSNVPERASDAADANDGMAEKQD